MAILSVLKFDTPTGAAKALAQLQNLQGRHRIEIQEAAIVEWAQGKKGPKTRQAFGLTESGALVGALLGVSYESFLGLAIGAAMGALTGKFSNFGIDDKFMKQVQKEVTEGTSALFLLTDHAMVDRIQQSIQGTSGILIRSELGIVQETSNGNADVLITRQGKPETVMIRYEDYVAMQDELTRLRAQDLDIYQVMLASEQVLRQEWDTPEEDAAWADL